MSDQAFSKHTRTSQLESLTWNDAVDAFRDRIVGWYFNPISRLEEHDAFLVLFAVQGALNAIGKFLHCSPVGLLSSVCKSWDYSTCSIVFCDICRFYSKGSFADVSISGTGQLGLYQNNKLIVDPWALADDTEKWFKSLCDDMISDRMSRDSCALRVSLLDAGVTKTIIDDDGNDDNDEVPS